MATEFTPTPAQQKAINEIDHNLQIIACAGSGKTEVITRRIANILRNRNHVKPENIVAFTFTEKAAESMKNRIAKALEAEGSFDISKMYVGTIHGFCYRLLNRYTEQFRDKKILDTVKNHLFVSRYFNECGMRDLQLELYPRNIALFLSCIDKMIYDYENADTWLQEQREVLDKYIDCLYSHGYIDFSLMIFETLRQLDKDPAAQDYLASIRYLVVDEYQDIDDLQEKLILRFAAAGANICVVGDDDQTIYQFRGSNADNMISFSERYADVCQVRLETNYRCDPGIVDVADCVIRNNERRLSKEMKSCLKSASSCIEANRYDSKYDQFAAIAEKITELHRSGVNYNDIAILVRKGKTIVPVSSALIEKGIPFETDSAEHFFNGNYFRRFVSTLQILTDVGKARLYEFWQDIADGASFTAGYKYLRSCTRGGNRPLREILTGFCEKINFLNPDAADLEKRKIDLKGISDILNDYDEIFGDRQLSARINGVLKFLDTQAAEEYKYHSFIPKDPNADAVQILTVHKAKGLEFHTVFLPELVSREFPAANIGGKQYWHVLGGVFEENRGKYQGDLEDERKLFYVAVTRAKQNLYLSFELSAHPVSCFVREAASSAYLKVERNILISDPKDM